MMISKLSKQDREIYFILSDVSDRTHPAKAKRVLSVLRDDKKRRRSSVICPVCLDRMSTAYLKPSETGEYSCLYCAFALPKQLLFYDKKTGKDRGTLVKIGKRLNFLVRQGFVKKVVVNSLFGKPQYAYVAIPRNKLSKRNRDLL